jgi:hypothetical protein
LLFAPVTFAGTPWVGNPGWGYRPGYAVGFGGLLGSLFARPAYGSYYFGNYFGSSYRGQGYVPWSNYGGRGYDPLLNYYRWANRGNPGWYGGLSGLYAGRLNGTLPVPGSAVPAGYNPALAGRHTVNFGRGVTVNPVNSLRTVHHVNAAHGGPVRLTPVTRPVAPVAVPTRQTFAAPAHVHRAAPAAAVPHTFVQPRVLTAPMVPHHSYNPGRVAVPHAAAPVNMVPQARVAHTQPVPYRGPAVHAAPAAAPRAHQPAPVAHAAPRPGPVAHGGGGHGGHRR